MKVLKEVQEAISSAPADAQLCFVLDWDLGDALAGLGGMSTRGEKRAALQEAARQVKQPVLDTLRKAPSVDVSDAEGATQTVVAATARQWRALLSDPHIQGAAGRILPNVTFRAD